MAALIEALRLEHSEMRRLLDLVRQQADSAPEPDLDLLHEIAEYCLTYPEQYHHPKEDLIYRALCRHDPEAALAIEDIQAEHRELAVQTRELAETIEAARASGGRLGGFRALLRSFVRSYRDHMRKEDQEFFPYAAAALTAEEWADLEAEVDDPTDSLLREKAAAHLNEMLSRRAADEVG